MIFFFFRVRPRGEIARALGRSSSSVADKAYGLGLRSGIQQGYESIPTAAARLGYEIATLKRVLKWSNVPIVEPPGRTSGPTRKRNFCVEIEAATLAAQRWVASETVTAAARARGISGGALKRWLRQAGHRNTRVAGQVWRLPSALIDRVVRERRSSETCREAAARVGVREETMRDWLLRAGVRPGRSGTWQVPREVVDRVAAERIATSRVPSIRAKAASAA